MLSPGSLLDGKYVIDRTLDSGGMGTVLAGRSVSSGEPVAVKVLQVEHANDEEMIARLLREATAVARLESPHIVRVRDAGRLPGGTPYLVMELLEGINLEAHLKKRVRLEVSEATLYIAQACEAVAEAHAHGVVHRDLKLQNLFLVRTQEGVRQIKVLDFGLAKLLRPDVGDESALTRTNVAMGSPPYMSPEQLRSTRDVDARTDIWSLGVCLYELLTGRMPFDAESPALLIFKILEHGPEDFLRRLPDIPAALVSIVDRCLRRDPAERWQSAGELRDALLPFTAHETPEASIQSVSTQEAFTPMVELATPPVSSVGRGKSSESEPDPMQAELSDRPWVAVLVLGAAVAAAALVYLVLR